MCTSVSLWVAMRLVRKRDLDLKALVREKGRKQSWLRKGGGLQNQLGLGHAVGIASFHDVLLEVEKMAWGDHLEFVTQATITATTLIKQLDNRNDCCVVTQREMRMKHLWLTAITLTSFFFLSCSSAYEPFQVKRHFRLSCERLQSISSCGGLLWCCKYQAPSEAENGNA